VSTSDPFGTSPFAPASRGATPSVAPSTPRPPRARVLASSRTRQGWLLAASPLLTTVLVTLHAVVLGALSWGLLALLAVVAAGATLSTAYLDVAELRRRGFVVTFSPHLVWATPLVYLVVRARRTRDDHLSYRLAWAAVGFTAASVAFVVEAVLTATWVLGTAALHG